jgi:hypothetical protein
VSPISSVGRTQAATGFGIGLVPQFWKKLELIKQPTNAQTSGHADVRNPPLEHGRAMLRNFPEQVKWTK